MALTKVYSHAIHSVAQLAVTLLIARYCSQAAKVVIVQRGEDRLQMPYSRSLDACHALKLNTKLI